MYVSLMLWVDPVYFHSPAIDCARCSDRARFLDAPVDSFVLRLPVMDCVRCFDGARFLTRTHVCIRPLWIASDALIGLVSSHARTLGTSATARFLDSSVDPYGLHNVPAVC